MIMALLTNDLFLSCLVSGISAQVIKYGIQTVKTRKLKLTPAHLLKKIFLETGGMPSSHSSTVTALSTSIALTEGIGTNFIIALAFALITIRDSFGVRYMSGVQAEYLNALSEKLKKEIKIDTTKIKVVKGHKKKEVLTGIIIGVVSAYIVCYL
ncbi:divergent PAP2 family protein [Borreliella valaisiana]|uniref:divergent PAP2 family protein n=1 Tax=Borreliella valaisiana TaxID=62088 RepID=UPI002ED3BD70|nr:divergent PAP2 family protein [Borreliella valaisiana]